MPLEDVVIAVNTITRPYLEKKQQAARFTSQASEVVINKLESLGDALEQSHEDLTSAIRSGVTLSTASRSKVEAITGVATGISHSLDSLAHHCTSNTYFYNKAMADQDHHDSAMTPVSPSGNEDLFANVHVAEASNTVDAELQRFASADGSMDQLLASTQGSEDRIQQLLHQFGEDATVKLGDFLRAMTNLGTNIERSGIDRIKQQMGKVVKAAEFMKRANQHADGIRQEVVTMRQHLSQAGSSRLNDLGLQIAKIGSYLGAVQCKV